MEAKDGSSVVIELRNSASAATSTIDLYVNGSLVGTSTGLYGGADTYFAVDFDGTVPEAGLVVNGTREINRSSSGSAYTVDNVLFGTGMVGTADVYLGDIVIFDDLTDLADAETQDVWVAWLDADGIDDGDASWTPSATTDLGDVTDQDTSTYTETTTDPDTLGAQFQSTADRLAGWSPSTIYGVAAVAYGTADVITSSTMTLNDGSGDIGAGTTTVLTSVGDFVATYEALNSSGGSWSLAQLNACIATYDVSS